MSRGGGHRRGRGRRGRGRRHRRRRPHRRARLRAAAGDSADQDAGSAPAAPAPGRRAGSPRRWARTTRRPSTPPTPWPPAPGSSDPDVVDAARPARGRSGSRALLALGARFDRDAAGDLALGREAAHSRRRILHARDATGAEMVRALSRRCGAPRTSGCWRRPSRVDLVVEGGRVVGPPGARRRTAAACSIRRRAVVLATGGLGRLYLHTTNPPEATGDGLAMAARAGARLVDLEFVQFHPTALAAGARPDAAPDRGAARRGRGADRRPRPPLHAGRAPGGRAGAARRRGARHLAPAGGRRAGLPRRPRRRGRPLPRALPDRLRALPRARPRPAPRADPGVAGGALPHGRHRGGRARPRPRSPASGPAARWPRPASTAPTGWPATRCSRRWSSAPAWPRTCARSAPPRRRRFRGSPAVVLRAARIGGGAPRHGRRPDAGRRRPPPDVGEGRPGARRRAGSTPPLAELDAPARGVSRAGGRGAQPASRSGASSPRRPSPDARAAAATSAPTSRPPDPAWQRRLFLTAAPDGSPRRRPEPALARREAGRRERGASTAPLSAPLRAAGAPGAGGGPRPRRRPDQRRRRCRPTSAAEARRRGARGGPHRRARSRRSPPSGCSTRGCEIEIDAPPTATTPRPARSSRWCAARPAPSSRPSAPRSTSSAASAASPPPPATWWRRSRRTARASSAPARPRPACAPWRSTRCAAAAAATTASASTTRVLIKDNHLALAGGLRPAVERARAAVGHLVKIEVEVDTPGAAARGARRSGWTRCCSTTWTSPTLRRGRPPLAAAARSPRPPAASRPDTAAAIAATGVDLLSVGWLTHSAPALDVALDVG